MMLRGAVGVSTDTSTMNGYKPLLVQRRGPSRQVRCRQFVAAVLTTLSLASNTEEYVSPSDDLERLRHRQQDKKREATCLARLTCGVCVNCSRLRWNRVRCVRLLVAVLLLALTGVLYRAFLVRTPPVFQKAEPVRDAEEARELVRTWNSAMTTFVTTEGACGISLSHLQVYKSYILFARQKAGAYNSLFNPRIVSFPPDAVRVTLRETSSMCYYSTDPPRALRRKRHARVRVAFRDINWKEHETVFDGNEAFCVQQLLDIVEGHWPCEEADSGHGLTRVPNQARMHTHVRRRW